MQGKVSTSEPDTGGHYWKLSRYEIRDGYICPAPGATTVSYNLWALHADWVNDSRRRKARRDRQGEARRERKEIRQPPYQHLLVLLERAGVDYRNYPWDFAEVERSGNRPINVRSRGGLVLSPERRIENGRIQISETDREDARTLRSLHRLSQQALTAILDFCNRFGLLGVLAHIVESIRLAPRVTAVDLRKATVMIEEHYRSNGKWCTREYYEDRITGADTVIGAVYNCRTLWPEVKIRHLEREGVIEPVIETEKLSDTWSNFFPEMYQANVRSGFSRATVQDNPNFQRFPRPLSPDFWRYYCEPVEEFLRYAMILQQAVEPKLESDGLLARLIPATTSHDFFKRLTAPVGALPDASGYWHCPSLLSAFAMMAYRDIAAGVSLKRCVRCSEPFAVFGYRAQFCSSLCRWRTNNEKRRPRPNSES